MSEYTERRWKCDCCGRSVKYEGVKPGNWHRATTTTFSHEVHSCPAVECQQWLGKWCVANDVYVPASLDPVALRDEGPRGPRPSCPRCGCVVLYKRGFAICSFVGDRNEKVCAYGIDARVTIAQHEANGVSHV